MAGHFPLADHLEPAAIAHSEAIIEHCVGEVVLPVALLSMAVSMRRVADTLDELLKIARFYAGDERI